MRCRDFLALGSLLTAVACGGTTTSGVVDGGAVATGGSGGVVATGGSGGVVTTGGSPTGGSPGVGGLGGGSGCVPPAPGPATREYLLTLSLSVNPRSPILFLAQTRMGQVGSGSAVELSLQALDARDRKTPVGSAIDLPAIPIGSDGQLVPTAVQLHIDGQANAIQVGLALDLTAYLHGQVCGVANFYCGTVTGNVTKPITIALAGSTFTMDHIQDPSSLPDPLLIDCAQHTAGPPPP